MELEISWWLETALVLASLAIVFFVVMMVVAMLKLREQSERLLKTIEDLRIDIQSLVNESREVLQDVKAISKRANQQLDDTERVVDIVRGWAERVNRIVHEVGAAIEPPILTTARAISVYRTGLVGFVQALFHLKDRNTKK